VVQRAGTPLTDTDDTDTDAATVCGIAWDLTRTRHRRRS
jgi:hypothetical protein